MTFDLAKLDTAKVAEEGADLRVAHPTTGEDLGITITLIGTDSKTFRDISKSRATASLKKKSREIDLDQNEAESVELLVTITEHNPIGDRNLQKLKGTRDNGSQDLTLGFDSVDAGQVVMQAALLSDSNYHFKIRLKSGDIIYYPGLVTKFGIVF